MGSRALSTPGERDKKGGGPGGPPPERPVPRADQALAAMSAPAWMASAFLGMSLA